MAAFLFDGFDPVLCIPVQSEAFFLSLSSVVAPSRTRTPASHQQPVQGSHYYSALPHGKNSPQCMICQSDAAAAAIRKNAFHEFLELRFLYLLNMHNNTTLTHMATHTQIQNVSVPL